MSGGKPEQWVKADRVAPARFVDGRAERVCPSCRQTVSEFMNGYRAYNFLNHYERCRKTTKEAA